MPLPSAIPLIARRYQLRERISAGSAGEVWRGTDVLLARPVAVKLLRSGSARDPQAVRRFRSEAHHAGTLCHECIAHVYDYGEPDPPQPPFLVMELVPGPSLAEVISGGSVSPARAMHIAARVAAGLQAAHSAGLVHRDIKPANILTGPDGLVKITDFGIARTSCSEPLTDTGMLVGTAAYLAPERVAGGQATSASDLYSLGVVTYQCLTGAQPFSGGIIDVALAHLERPFPPLPASVPEDVSALIRELTAKDPAARPGGAADVACRAAQLRDHLTRRPASAKASPLAMREPRPARGQGLRTGRARRRPVRTGAVATAAAVFAAAGMTLASENTPAPVRRAPAVSATPPGPALTTVKLVMVPASLAGRPAEAVLRYLRRHAVFARLQWQASSSQRPGTVLSVQPAGRVPAGTHVTVTVAVRPAAAASHRKRKDPPARADQGHGRGHGGEGHDHGQGRGRGAGPGTGES